MRLTSIQMEQMGPYQGERLSFHRNGLHVYLAANEAGKSTIVAALRGALFGQARSAENTAALRRGATVRLQVEDEDGGWVQVERNLSKRNPPRLQFPSGQTSTGQQELIRAFPELETVEQVLYETFFTIQLADLTSFADKPGALASQLFGVRAPLINPYQLEADLEKRMRDIYLRNRRATKPLLNARLKERAEVEQALRNSRDRAGWYRLLLEEKATLLREEQRLMEAITLLGGRQTFFERCLALREPVNRLMELEAQLSPLGNCPPGNLDDWRGAVRIRESYSREADAAALEQEEIEQLEVRMGSGSQYEEILALRPQISQWRMSVGRIRGILSDWQRENASMRKREAEALHLQSELPPGTAVDRLAAVGRVDTLGSSLREAADRYETRVRSLQEATHQYAFAQTWEESRREAYACLDERSYPDIQSASSSLQRDVSHLRRTRDEVLKNLGQLDDWIRLESSETGRNQASPRGGNGVLFLLALLLLCGAGIEFAQRQWLAMGILVAASVILTSSTVVRIGRRDRSKGTGRRGSPALRARGSDFQATPGERTTTEARGALMEHLHDIDSGMSLLEQRQAALTEWQQAVHQVDMRDAEVKAATVDCQRYQETYKALLADAELGSTLWTKAELMQLSATARDYIDLRADIDTGQSQNSQRRREVQSLVRELAAWASAHDAILPGSQDLCTNIERVIWEDEQAVLALGVACEKVVLDWGKRADAALEQARSLDKLRERRKVLLTSMERRRRLMEELQEQLEELFRQLNVGDWDSYQASLQREETRRSLHQQYERVIVDLTVACTSERAAARVSYKLKHTSDSALEMEQIKAAREAQEAQERLQANRERVWDIGRQLEESETGNEGAKLRWKSAQLDAQVQSYKEKYAALALARALSRRARMAVEERHSSPVLRLAGHYLERITDGRYLHLRIPLGSNGLQQIYVVDASGTHWQLSDLSRGTREQVYLSLRLAVICEYREQGIILPVVLDDPLVNFDDERARRVLDLLRDEGRAQPMIYLTCHRRLIDEFRDDEDVHIMTDRVHQEEWL